MDKKVAFITAIYGNITEKCTKICEQTVDSDFICFTDNENINHNNTSGWIIDNNPYHITHHSHIDDGNYNNSFCNNNNPRNIAKYYKLQFYLIPRLEKYDIIIWVDSSITLKCDTISEYIHNLIISTGKSIYLSHNEKHSGHMLDEIRVFSERCPDSFYFKRGEPPQKFFDQYATYVQDGYSDDHWKNMHIMDDNPHYGLWFCAFIAYNMKNKHNVLSLLDLWFLQNLKFTNRDQLSFPYVCYKLNIIPYTFPDNYMRGIPHYDTTFYTRIPHKCYTLDL
jgi:hypothetical protein